VATPPLRRYERTSAPLSFGQERLWFLHQLERSSAAYHLPYALRLCGVLDLGALARTLAAIVARHESLRTSFVVQDGTPMQQIAPAAACPLRLCDLATLPTAHAEALVQGLARAEAQRPFDLAGGPLLRLALLRLAPDAHVLLLTMHHIIADGWSIGVLIREVAALYAAHGSLTDAALLPLSIQYADYAIWQRAWLTDERLEQQLSYWRHTLADAPPLLALPTDYPRPPVPSFAGASQALALDQATVRALQALSQKHAATLFMTLLAAFQVLLARLSGQDDILIGSPIAGRTHAEAERLIGFFVNTLVLRTKLTATTSFAALLPQVRATCLQAYAHQELPFEQLVEALHPVRNLQVSPLFQVMFVLQNAPQSALELGDLTLQPLATPNSSAKFDLTLTLYETSQGLNGSLEYATTLFDATTIARLASHFRTLLGAVLATPEACIADLPLLSAAERSQLLHEWNDTTAEYPRDATIHAIFEAQAARLPDAVAVVYGGQALTYAALNQRANQLAHYLGTCGVGPEAVVGIAMPRSLDLPVGLLSILKAGGVYLPLDPDLPAQRLVSMLDNARVGTLLVSDQATVLHPTVQGSCTVVMLDRAWEQIAEQPAENPDLAIAADNLAYVMYTSGSSGQPKGVAIPHRGVLRLVCGNHYAQLRAACTLLQLAPIVFDASTFELWGMLLNGGHCVLLPEAVPTTSALQQAISAYGVSTLWLTATLFNKMVDQLPQALAGVQELLIGGEALSVAHVQRAQQALPQTQIINGYGPTESTTFACCYPIPSVMTLRGSSIPLGGPIANTTAYILDARLSLVPLGTAGELYLGGAGLARGYLGRPDLTAERFVPNPFAEVSGIGYRVPGAETSDTRYPTPATRLYRTGDLARWRADGTIEYLGRIDGQVKLRGYRIELGEIEATLVQHEEVQTCAMLLREDVPGERRLVAYVVPADEGRRTEDESEPSSFVLRPSSFVADLRAFLAERLPTYMIPSAFMLLDALPLTPNGKLDRRALPAPDMQASEAIFVAPRGENEELLAGIWAEVLRRERVGIHDEFFVVGGHSLLATQVIARIRQVFGVELPLRALFETPTVADLAARIATMQDIARQLGAQRDRVLEDVEEIEL
jgi:amino acid adenylation domain-containing protein